MSFWFSLSSRCELPSNRSIERAAALVLLLGLALFGCSCATNADAAGNNNLHSLSVSGSLPDGKVSQSYNAVLSVSGGSSPYQFSLDSGSLPPGITLNRSTGSLTGSPTASGTFTFQILVTDSPSVDKGSQTFIVKISTSSKSGINVSVSPTAVALPPAGRQQFTATVTGTSKTGVTWTASSGSIDTNGLYTAPSVQSATNVTVTAASQASSTQTGSAAVAVNPNQGQQLQITTSSLPPGQQGSSYSDAFAATGGTQPYSWSVSSGKLPSGLTLNSNGNLSGTPTANGTFEFSVMATDAKQGTANASFSVTVTQGSGYDGPAQLPLATVATAMSDSPAPGAVISVNAGGDLQAALNQVQCGQTIQLQAGAAFGGQFTVRAKNCDANHWIIIRTSSPDSALPAEGQRLTPCYAGVSSLPGRPTYNCANPQNALAAVQMTRIGDGPFQLATGANYYRFLGLEITRPVGAFGPARLISFQGTADHIIVDRSWMHGQVQDETGVAFAASGGTNIALIDSYVTDLHCIAIVGTCTDAHAFSGGVSDTQDGPFLIQDNFLEASGEAVMFGGGPATKSPADITIQNNHFWKPWQWMPGSPNFVGGPDGHPFIVKNHMELKNAVRVLVQANLMENNWGGFTQHGYAVLLTPKNQYTKKGKSVCPACQVTDVTFRYNQISHSASGFELGTGLSDGGTAAMAGARYSIHDVVVDDLSTKYVGGGTGFEIANGWPKNPLNTVTINHVTVFPDTGSHIMIIGNYEQHPQMYGLVFTNNLVLTGEYPVWNSLGSQGGTSCSDKDVPVTIITRCFTTYTFRNNGLIASPSAFPPSDWPASNFFPASPDAVEFVNYNGGNGGNYELQSSSPYKNKGTDGKDLGADIVGLQQQLANVE